jgi:hypothetical protein
VEPRILDTKSKVKTHKFWEALLPIFDKYYQQPNGSFGAQEIGADLRELELAANTLSMTLREGFESFETFKIRAPGGATPGKKQLATNT